MLAVRLIPNGHNLDARISRHHYGPQLCLGLMGKTVSDAEGVFGKLVHEEEILQIKILAESGMLLKGRGASRKGAKAQIKNVFLRPIILSLRLCEILLTLLCGLATLRETFRVSWPKYSIQIAE